MASGGVHFVQIDSCRVAGVNEIILILLMAKKFNLPVCPHAGGVGTGLSLSHAPPNTQACIFRLTSFFGRLAANAPWQIL